MSIPINQEEFPHIWHMLGLEADSERVKYLESLPSDQQVAAKKEFSRLGQRLKGMGSIFENVN